MLRRRKFRGVIHEISMIAFHSTKWKDQLSSQVTFNVHLVILLSGVLWKKVHKHLLFYNFHLVPPVGFLLIAQNGFRSPVIYLQSMTVSTETI